MKMRRHRKILEIIKNQVISTQEELADALRAAGFVVTQATVSRDIKDLRLVKITTGENAYRYGIPREQNFAQNEDRLRRMLQEMVTSIAESGNIVVLKTYPGNAHSVASLIDGANWPEVIGTVAGDDTILLVVKNPRKQEPTAEVTSLLRRLKSLME